MTMRTVRRRTIIPTSVPLLLLALAAACGSKSDGTGSVTRSSGPGASSNGGTGSSVSTPPTTGSSATATGSNGTGSSSSGMSTSGGAPAPGGTVGPGTSGGNSSDSGASGNAEAGITPATDAADTTPAATCNPADELPDATPVAFAAPSEGPGLSTPTGPFTPIMESDPGIPTHTIIRPDPLGTIKHPILAWGEGGCAKSGNGGMFSNLFMEFASHGVLIIADGPADPSGPTNSATDATPLLAAIDWAQKENERPCSKYYHKLAVDKVGVSGQSCGGLMAIDAAVDPRITTAFPYDSGLFSRDQTIYDALHAPMAYFNGGDQDIAYSNGLADFNAITNIPMLFAYPTSCSSNAHVCTFFDTNAGAFGRAGVAWINWWLFDDQSATGKGMFIGNQCGLCDTSKWTLTWNALKPM